jgi:phospholipase C
LRRSGEAGTLFPALLRRRAAGERAAGHCERICTLVEAKRNLPAMTHRDANAHNMPDMLDLKDAAFARPPKLAKPQIDADPSALACDTNGPATIPPPGSVT